jgi:glycerol kinase
MAYQSCDLLSAMRADAGLDVSALKVDGGASVNDALLQFQADLLGIPVQRPVVAETTALGAAYLAGLAVGYWHDKADLMRNWTLDRQFTPRLAPEQREALNARWQEAVRRCLAWAPCAET